VWHFAELEQEPLLCVKRDRARLPDHTRLYREVARFDAPGMLSRLRPVGEGLLRAALADQPWYTLDCDSTVETVYYGQEWRGTMAWDETKLGRFDRGLAQALDTYDWERVDTLCGELIEQVRHEADCYPELRARTVLGRLRRKRRFRAMALVAEALIESRLPSLSISVQYGQALIECGYLTPAALVLRSAADIATRGSLEESEIAGLLGRIDKQRYVSARRPADPRYRAYLVEAIAHYLRGYEANPAANYWHGMNAAALIMRAERDHVPSDTLPDAKRIAESVLIGLSGARPIAEMPAWALATILEARLALQDHGAAEMAALCYANAAEADAFEYASTLRQLTEVWELDDNTPLGSHVLPIVRAALLRRQGGRIALGARSVQVDLEKNFGAERFRTLKWYLLGLERCKAIARIETKAERGQGTGWLVSASELFPARPADEKLLITNAHVIGPGGFPGALLPQQVRVNFSMTQTVCGISHVVWSSPPSQLDATIAALDASELPTASLPLAAMVPQVKAQDRPPRLYVIGHPDGRGLEFSLHDNVMLASNERVLHYRTPTDSGSSGSPVFDEENWEVVALHHGGRAKMTRLNGEEGVYEANEGIAIQAIRKAIQP
jgi:Trypsin-like peptidase domain/Tetratricopeptide Repeats-Sensor